MAKRKFTMLNVKNYIEHVVWAAETMLEDADRKWPNGIVLPPAYQEDLRMIRVVGRAILKKHASKKTRKDIYVEKKG